MTRTDYEQSVANKLGIINALKDNVGDEFTALEISAAMIDPPDLKPLQIGAVLKSMVAEGLVSKRPSKNMNVYRLTKKALTWGVEWLGEPIPHQTPQRRRRLQRCRAKASPADGRRLWRRGPTFLVAW